MLQMLLVVLLFKLLLPVHSLSLSSRRYLGLQSASSSPAVCYQQSGASCPLLPLVLVVSSKHRVSSSDPSWLLAVSRPQQVMCVQQQQAWTLTLQQL